MELFSPLFEINILFEINPNLSIKETQRNNTIRIKIKISMSLFVIRFTLNHSKSKKNSYKCVEIVMSS